jgi:hypothetical protein
MSIDSYYLSKKLTSMGDLYFLKVLQEADSPGGGLSLLGSVLQEIHDGIWPFRTYYPAPLHMTTPRLIIKFMDAHRNLIKFEKDESLTLEAVLSSEQSTITIDKKEGGGVDAGPFPGLPLNLGMDVDYSRMGSVVFSLGAGSKICYIPTGYFARLYTYEGGHDENIDSTGIIGRNFITNSILLAKEFTVTFNSTDAFTTDFNAKVQAFGNVPGVSGNIKYEIHDGKSLAASVKGDKWYLIALEAKRWSDFDHA